jgi:hypothetical protein
VIVLFLLHPNVTTLAFSMFSCKALGVGPENQYLLNDLSQQCYRYHPLHTHLPSLTALRGIKTEHDVMCAQCVMCDVLRCVFGSTEHLFWIYRVTLPLLVFVIGIPVLAWCFLRFNLKYIQEERSFPEEAIRMKEKFGFLYNGYQTDRWYWEFMVVFRKVGLVMISVFLVANVQVQALAALALCTIAIMAHVLFTPFSAVMMDLMEFFSLVCVMCLFVVLCCASLCVAVLCCVLLCVLLCALLWMFTALML